MNKRSKDKIDRRNGANREIMDEIRIDRRKDAKRKKRTMEWRKMKRCVAAAVYLFRVTKIT